MQSVASSMINAMWIMGNESRERTRIWISLIISITVEMMKVLGKRVTREGKGYNKMGHMDKRLSSRSSFKQYRDY